MLEEPQKNIQLALCCISQGILKKIIMKKFSLKQMIIINNLIMILLLGFSLTGLIVTCDIIFIYMFVTCCPVALVTMLTLDKYEKEF